MPGVAVPPTRWQFHLRLEQGEDTEQVRALGAGAALSCPIPVRGVSDVLAPLR